MGLLKSVNQNFTQEFFEKEEIYSFYTKISNRLNNRDLKLQKDTISAINSENIYKVEFIPSFIDVHLNNSKKTVAFFSYNYFKGFSCDLSSFKSSSEYMRNQLGKSGTKLVIRRLKRLETCFNISYKWFHGDIDKSECSEIIESLRLMIEKRFNQRGEVHSSLKNWEFYSNTTYDQILRKKASLFVVYSNDEPIGISLDYLCDNLFESAISSYDIDYAKFGLGNTIILKKMDWCIENGYKIFNMRYGDYAYKRYWCNYIFDYKSQIIYSKKSLKQMVKALLIAKINKTMGYVIMNKERFIFLSKLKRLLQVKSKVNKDIELVNSEFILNEVENTETFKNFKTTIIDLKSENFAFLRKAVFDFQYVHSANKIDVYILETGDPHVYLFRVKNEDYYMKPVQSLV